MPTSPTLSRNSASQKLIALETAFWQSMVDHNTDAAIDMLGDTALMVSSHGAMKFDHAGYRKMAEEGSMVVTSFKLKDLQVMFPNDATAILTYRVKQGVAPRDDVGHAGQAATVFQEMNDSSTWVMTGGEWKCVMHTETPMADLTVKH